MRRADGHKVPDERGRFRHVGLALSIMTCAQLGASFGTQWYTVTQLGAGPATDALYAGFTFPQVLMVTLIDPLGFILTPMLSVLSIEERRAVGWRVLCMFSGLTVLAVGVLWLLAPFILPLLVPGFSTATSQLTLTLARIQLAAAVGAACIAVLSSLYHAGHKFLWPVGATLICTILGWGILLAALREGGVLLAALVQVFCFAGPAVLLLPVVGQSPWGKPCNFSRFLREIWRQAKPLLASTVYYRTGFLVDRFLTSLLAPGSLVILELAWRMHTAFIRIVNQGITTPVIPTLTILWNQRNMMALRHHYRQRLAWISGLGLMTLIGLMSPAWLPPGVIDGISHSAVWGTWGPEDVHKFWLALVAGSGVVLFGGVNHFAMSAFYTQSDTATPVKLQMTAYTVGMILKVGGFVLGGLLGILMAMSVSYLLEALLLGTALRRRVVEKPHSERESVLSVGTAGVTPLQYNNEINDPAMKTVLPPV